MSTSTTRHGSKIYRYYRCRSASTGKKLCRRTQVPAGKIEKEVCHVLANLPERVPKRLLTDHLRGLFLRFSAAWSLLSSEAIRHALPKVIHEIIHNPVTGKVTVNLDLEAIELDTLAAPRH